MQRFRLLLAMVALLCVFFPAVAAGPRKDYPVRPVPMTAVRHGDGFWASRLDVHAKATMPACFEQSHKTGRIDNFAVAGGLKKGEFKGYLFNDSDVVKVLEGACTTQLLRPSAALKKEIDDLVVKIAAAQEDDGYLDTHTTLRHPKRRWHDIRGAHELYIAGHMYESAVAHWETTGSRAMLDVAVKNADLICKVFHPKGRTDPPGHQEIELALFRFYRATGNEKYLRQAKFFLDQRGRPGPRKRGLYGVYAQDHKPLVEQMGAEGHAVRAAYCYAGMADAAALTGDAAYGKAVTRIWEDVLRSKLYVTGGIGATAGHEGFDKPFLLPNSSAYSETCGGIANALWNHRMFLLTGDGKYLDVMERSLYNNVLAGVSLDGKSFFYPNPLASFRGGKRSTWFACACCPSNIARIIPSVGGWAYAHEGDRVYVGLFMPGTATVKTAKGTVTLTQHTRYPWDGDVRVTVDPKGGPREFELRLRIPGWARNRPVPSTLYAHAKKRNDPIVVEVNGKAVPSKLDKGFARIRRTWKKGDTVRLRLAMPVRRVLSDRRVEACAGRVALERGPLVYCLEGHDNPDGQVMSVLLKDDAPLTSEYRKDLLGGVAVIRGTASVLARTLKAGEYRESPVAITAIPYYAWANRGPAQMAVWIAREPKAAMWKPAPTLAYRSTITVSGGRHKEALCDQNEPAGSGDYNFPFFHWWPKSNAAEWVQYTFPKAHTVRRVKVYWFDDGPHRGCRVPASWRVVYRQKGKWKPVTTSDPYGTAKDRWHAVTFKPVTTDALRLEVQLPKSHSSGIREWVVE
jgi:DUF1680 family protein